jgi:hypothetical protein
MKLLCEKSTYFWATFIGGFAEAGTGVSRLPEIDAETSEDILKWMMSGMLATPKKGPGGARSFIDERVKVLPLVRIYLAAQYLVIEELRKAAVRTFQEAVWDGKENEASGCDKEVHHPTYHRHSFWPTATMNSFLDHKPGFSQELVKLVVENDSSREMQKIVKKRLVRAVLTGGEHIGIYAEILEKSPEFAPELMKEMQRSPSNHWCLRSSADSCGWARHSFEGLKQRPEKEGHNRTQV